MRSRHFFIKYVHHPKKSLTACLHSLEVGKYGYITNKTIKRSGTVVLSLCAGSSLVSYDGSEMFLVAVCGGPYFFTCLSLVVSCLQVASSVPLADFYPFGSVAGDAVLPENDDGSSEALYFNVPFQFFGLNFSTAYVNNNGHITFANLLRDFTPRPFPTQPALVAPFWGDVISGSVELGQVYYQLYCSLDYRLTGSSCNNSIIGTLERAKSDVRSAFCDQDFIPAFVLVATWFQVGYYRNGINKKNTFQVVLISDGVRSYVMFLYLDNGIQWTTGDASGGSNGTGGTPALAGVNAGYGDITSGNGTSGNGTSGDDDHFYTLPGSLAHDVINIAKTSNLNVPGKWMFQVDMKIFHPHISTDCYDACQNNNPCSNGGTCVNTQSNVSCFCSAYFRGDTCNEDSSVLYSFGLSQGDKKLPKGSTCRLSSPQVQVELSCFPFGSKQHSTFYVSNTGHVSFDHRLLSCYPNLFGEYFPGNLQYSVVAPFWTKVNTMKCGQVFYHSYTIHEMGGQSYLDRVTKDIREYAGAQFSNFSARWVLIATWDGVCIFPSYSYENTFQLVMASDGYDSFAIMIYPTGKIKEPSVCISCGIQDPETTRKMPKALVGFRSSDGSLHCNYPLPSAEEMDNIDSPGDSKSKRVLIYRLTKDDNPCKQNKECLNWYDQDLEKEGALQLWTLYVPPCPCSLEQAENDDRYQGVNDVWPEKKCFVSVILVEPQNVQTECCYSLKSSDSGSLITSPPRAGSANRYHSVKESEKHEQFDVAPYKACCETTDLCYLYYSRRPTVTCTLYRPPGWVWAWGDPHILTLDGNFYTFNGLGEYILMKTVNETFVLEARTRLVMNSTASVFSAVAAAQFLPSDNGFHNSVLDSSVVHVELTTDNRLILLVCCYGNNSQLDASTKVFSPSGWKNVTADFYNLPMNSSLILDNAILIRRGEHWLVALFSLEIAIRVEVKTNSLAFVFVAPSEMKGDTRGLLGVWDDDTSNDFTMSNGTVLSQNSSDSQIHSYGLTWQIRSEESLFFYDEGTGVSSYAFPDHKPVFADEIANLFTLEQKVACQDDPACMFDAFETGDVQLGLETHTTNLGNQVAVTALQTFPPIISAHSTVIRATLGQTIKFEFNVTDDTSFNVTLSGQPPPIQDYNLTTAGDVVVFTWTPSKTHPVSLLFIITDVHGLNSQLHPLVRLCACRFDKNASCIEAESDGGENQFVLEKCQCGQGWEGQFCGIDINACATVSCISGSNCTDHSAPEVGFDCYPCPEGTIAKDGLCEGKLHVIDSLNKYRL
jgi:hypothetical protein